MAVCEKIVTIAVAAYDGINPFHLSIPSMVFESSRDKDDGAPRLKVMICGTRKGEIKTSMGFSITPQHTIADFSQAQIVIVPSWQNVEAAVPPPLIEALKIAHQRGAKVVGLCLGTFVLAEAGLLDGKLATTHWKWADTFIQRYPAVRLDAAQLYIDQGDVVTSAGVAAAIDCCLHLLRQICGAEVANQVARKMVVAPHRQGGQAQFIDKPLPVSRQDDRLSQLLQWITLHPELPHTIDSLAEKAMMSRRTFTRHIRQITGTTVMQWLLDQRLAKARRMLESGSQPVETIAVESGFGSATSLRQHFAKTLNISPSLYRRQFRIKNLSQ